MTRIKTSEDELFASSFERNKKDAEYIRSTNYAGFIPGPWYITRYPVKEEGLRHIRATTTTRGEPNPFLACENVAGQCNAATLQLMADAPILLEDNLWYIAELKRKNAEINELRLALQKIMIQAKEVVE